MLIDCRTLSTRAVPIPADSVVVIMDTATRRGLVDSAYNERRSQCEAAAAFFGVKALRDVTPEVFERRVGELDPMTARRARHVVTENARTLAAAEAMCADDSATLGELMSASHQSLRDDFEVSSDALDAIVDIAQRQSSCHGARMTGAGFGGCAVALVERELSSAFAATILIEYEKQMALVPQIYVTGASDGAAIISPSV
jgi:galactokinase